MLTYELLLSLLSHDVYNRGPDPDIPSVEDLGSTLGNFEMFQGDGQEIGFYAVAYRAKESGNGFEVGDMVISYRGTDPSTVNGQVQDDVFKGWSVGADFEGNQFGSAGSQAGLG